MQQLLNNQLILTTLALTLTILLGWKNTIRKFTVSDASFLQTALIGEVGKNKQKNQEVAKI